MASRKKRKKSTPGETSASRLSSDLSSLSTPSPPPSFSAELQQDVEANANFSTQSTAGLATASGSGSVASQNPDTHPRRIYQTPLESHASQNVTPEPDVDAQPAISTPAWSTKTPAARKRRPKRSTSAQDVGKNRLNLVWTRGFDPTSLMSGNQLIKEARDLHYAQLHEDETALSPPRRFNSPASLQAREWAFVHHDSLGELPEDLDMSDDLLGSNDPTLSSNVASRSAETASILPSVLRSQGALLNALNIDRTTLNSTTMDRGHVPNNNNAPQQWGLPVEEANRNSVAMFLDLPGATHPLLPLDSLAEDASTSGHGLNSYVPHQTSFANNRAIWRPLGLSTIAPVLPGSPGHQFTGPVQSFPTLPPGNNTHTLHTPTNTLVDFNQPLQDRARGPTMPFELHDYGERQHSTIASPSQSDPIQYHNMAWPQNLHQAHDHHALSSRNNAVRSWAANLHPQQEDPESAHVSSSRRVPSLVLGGYDAESGGASLQKLTNSMTSDLVAPQRLVTSQSQAHEQDSSAANTEPIMSLRSQHDQRQLEVPRRIPTHDHHRVRSLQQQQIFGQQHRLPQAAARASHPPPPPPRIPPQAPGPPPSKLGKHQQIENNPAASQRTAGRRVDHMSNNSSLMGSELAGKKSLAQLSQAQPSREQPLKRRLSDLNANNDAQLRSSRASRLAARSHQDTDVLSGYPARQWLKETSNVSLVPPKAPQSTEAKTQSVWTAPPMPKGSEMYQEFSQKLLARLRAPQVPEEDKETPEEGEEDAMGEEDHAVKLPKYSLIPLGRETPGRRFLADRRKGLPSLYEGSGTVQAKRSAKVRQTLADGSEHIIEVLVPEGQTMPGEVSEAVAPAVSAELLPAGTVVEGVGVANSAGVVVAASEATTPQSNRRKPPPPKRKKTHPMKGKKKKVMLEVPNAEGGVDMVESGTPRQDEDDDGDDDEGDDGEATEDATPTPASGGTPAAMPEPPRSVPADVVSEIPVESESTQAQGEQLDEKMDVDAVAVTANQEQDKPSVDETGISAGSAPAVLPASEQHQTAAAMTGSDTAVSIPKEANATLEDVPTSSSHDGKTAGPDQQNQASTPQLNAEGEPISMVTTGPTSEEMSQSHVEPSPVSLTAPQAVVQPLQPVEPPLDTAIEPQSAPSAEIPVSSAGIPADAAMAEVPSAADSTPAETVAQDTLPEALRPEEIATSNPVVGETSHTETGAAHDTIPEALKPEEVATSNPAGDATAPSEPKEEKEQKETGTDILGSLELSLG